MGLFKMLRKAAAVAKLIAPNRREVDAAIKVEQAAETVRDLIKTPKN